MAAKYLRTSEALLRIGVLCAALLLRQSLPATPYAAALQIAPGNVSFVLNEQADEVLIVSANGQGVSLGCSPCEPGPYSAPYSGDSFEIVVRKNSSLGWLRGVTNQISSASNASLSFVHPRGIAVNRNPVAGSNHFGRIYVSVALPGTNTLTGRVLAEGIFVLDPHLEDALGQGNNGRSGGLNFASPANNDLSPYRLTIGPDNQVYICDFSTSTGNLYVTDPEINLGVPVFGGATGGLFPVGNTRVHGSIAAAHVEGSHGATDDPLKVWVIDEDLQSNKTAGTRSQCNSIWLWDIAGVALPFSNPPPVRLLGSPLLGISSQIADLVRGPTDHFYASQLREAPATAAGLFVLIPDGTRSNWNSLAASRMALNNPSATDILTETVAIDVSHDGKYIAVLRRDNNTIHIIPLVAGLPDMTNRIELVLSPTNGPANDIAFDVANNIYTISSEDSILRVYSPGGYSTATTRSDGTFSLEIISSMTIIAIQQAMGNMVHIDFVSPEGGEPADFRVEASSSLESDSWEVQNSASISFNNGVFRAITRSSEDTRFYRIRR